MILLHRKVFPRPGRPTRMIMSFCLSTLFLFRTFPGPRLFDTKRMSRRSMDARMKEDSLADGIKADYGLIFQRRGLVDSV